MNNEITPSQKSALARAIKDPALLPLLVQKISGLKWFEAFEEAGFLKPENNPRPIQTEQEGYFRVPSWVVADYLVTSSALLNNQSTSEYAKKYLQLLRDVTHYAKQNEVGNYRTWWQFAKILSNLPSQIISVSDIDLIEFWLSDKFDSGILLDELSTWILHLLKKPDTHSKSLILALLAKFIPVLTKRKNLVQKEVLKRCLNTIHILLSNSLKKQVC